MEAQGQDGTWKAIYREENNYQRLVRLPLGVEAKALRVIPEEIWGAAGSVSESATKDAAKRGVEAERVTEMRVFSVDVLAAKPESIGVEEGEPWLEVVARVPAKDLAPPENQTKG